MLCGSFNSPQLGHSWNLVGVSAWWLRRMFRFDGEVFLLGTAIAAPSKAIGTTIKIATICASSQRVAPQAAAGSSRTAAPIAERAVVARVGVGCEEDGG